MSDEQWNLSVLDINLRGTFIEAREVVQAMIVAQGARIMNLASTQGIMGGRSLRTTLLRDGARGDEEAAIEPAP